MDFQAEKTHVRAFHDALSGADVSEIGGVVDRFASPDLLWRGMHPFNELTGPQAVAKTFWAPLRSSLSRLQRRPQIFIAGLNEIDDFRSVWVTSMGHLMGLFDQPWLGIRPTQRIAMLPYAEFNKVENGRITETAMFIDILSVMNQAGQYPLAPATGAHLVHPGPATQDGLLFDPQPKELGVQTLARINSMLGEINSRPEGCSFEDEVEELSRNWSEDMVWWGPTGIGATYTSRRYIQQHCQPFAQAFGGTRRFNGHLCRLAEGNYGGFFGWANLTMQNMGGYLGMTAGAAPADMRVVDMYRAENDQLVENWIFIDLLHYLNMQGLDVLKRTERLNKYDLETTGLRTGTSRS